MSKFFALLLMLVFSSFSLSAQEDNRDALIDLLAEETCTCMDGKELSQMSQEEMEMAIGLCILSSFSEHGDRFPDIEIDISNARAMEKMGEDIGFRMLGHCPNTLMQLAGSAEDLSVEDTELVLAPPPPSNLMSAEGTLIRVDGGELSRVIIKDDASGEKTSLIWMGRFSGDEILLQESSNWKGKPVLFTYGAMEIYDAEKGTYISKKLIVDLKILE